MVTKFLAVGVAVLFLVPVVGCCSKDAAKGNAASSTITAESGVSSKAPLGTVIGAGAGDGMPARSVQVNYSALGPDNQGEELTLTGIVEKSGDGYCLEMNAQSRSKVTFVLDPPANGDSAAAIAAWNQLPQLTGKTVTVTGILTDCSATWTKHMTVTSVVSE